jgi:hypothetical protein
MSDDLRYRREPLGVVRRNAWREGSARGHRRVIWSAWPRSSMAPRLNLPASRWARGAFAILAEIFVSAGPGRDALKVVPEFPVLHSRVGQVGTVAYTSCVRRTRPVLCRPGSEGDRTHPDGGPRGDRLPVPHEGTCRGIPPLRREPYAGLRRVSHEKCPERSRRRGRRVLARRLRARADCRPGRSQDDHQRTELWREDLPGRLRGQQHADVRRPGHRAA